MIVRTIFLRTTSRKDRKKNPAPPVLPAEGPGQSKGSANSLNFVANAMTPAKRGDDFLPQRVDERDHVVRGQPGGGGEGKDQTNQHLQKATM